MSLIIDIVLLVITLLCVLRHARLGFVKSVLNSLKTIAAAAVAYLLRNPVATFIDESFINQPIVSWVKTSLMESASGADPTINFVTLYEDCAPAYESFLAFFGLQVEGIDTQLSNISTIGEQAIDALALNIGSAISWFASLAIAILAVFIIALIVLSIVIAIVNLVTKLPVVRLVNRLLGAALGLAWAALFAFGVGTIITLIIEFLPGVVSEAVISESVILGFMMELGVLDIVPGMI